MPSESRLRANNSAARWALCLLAASLPVGAAKAQASSNAPQSSPAPASSPSTVPSLPAYRHRDSTEGTQPAPPSSNSQAQPGAPSSNSSDSARQSQPSEAGPQTAPQAAPSVPAPTPAPPPVVTAEPPTEQAPFTAMPAYGAQETTQARVRLDPLGSAYIPVDSWVYPAMMRLYSMGYLDTICLLYTSPSPRD